MRKASFSLQIVMALCVHLAFKAVILSSERTSLLKRWVICQSHLSRKTIRTKKWHTAAFNWRCCTDTSRPKWVIANTTHSPVVYLNWGESQVGDVNVKSVKFFFLLKNVTTLILMLLSVQKMYHFHFFLGESLTEIVEFYKNLKVQCCKI